MSRPGPEADQQRAEAAAQRAAREAEEKEAAPNDVLEAGRGNTQRAALAAHGRDPGGPPSDRPDDVVDVPSAPAQPSTDEDVEPLLMGDPDWRPPPPPAPRLPDLSGWVDVPGLSTEVRAAWRRRAGLGDERPSGPDPGVALLLRDDARAPSAAAWLRAVAATVADDATACVLLAEALAPTTAWVARGGRARLDAARVALGQLVLSRVPGRTAEAHVRAALAGVEVDEARVVATGARFPSATRVLGLTDAPTVADAPDPQWAAHLSGCLGGAADLAYVGPTDDAELTRRALAAHGLVLARAVSRLRIRVASVARALLHLGATTPGAAVHAARGVDADTDSLLVGLRDLGRGLHHTPRVSTSDALRRVHDLSGRWGQLRIAAGAALSTLATNLPVPVDRAPHPVLRALTVGDLRAARALLPADATLARWALDPRTAPPAGGVADLVVALLAGASPGAHPDAPALVAVAALDRLEAGEAPQDVLRDAIAALRPARAGGALELLLAGVRIAGA